MTADAAELGAVGVDQAWDPVGHETSGTGCDDQAERMGTDQTVLNVEPIFTKIRWLVHAKPLRETDREYTEFPDLNADFRSIRPDLIGEMPGENFPDPGFPSNDSLGSDVVTHCATMSYNS